MKVGRKNPDVRSIDSISLFRNTQNIFQVSALGSEILGINWNNDAMLSLHFRFTKHQPNMAVGRGEENEILLKKENRKAVQSRRSERRILNYFENSGTSK